MHPLSIKRGRRRRGGSRRRSEAESLVTMAPL